MSYGVRKFVAVATILSLIDETGSNLKHFRWDRGHLASAESRAKYCAEGDGRLKALFSEARKSSMLAKISLRQLLQQDSCKITTKSALALLRLA